MIYIYIFIFIYLFKILYYRSFLHQSQYSWLLPLPRPAAVQAVMLKELGDRKYGMSLARDDLQNYVDADEVAVPVVSEVIGHMKIQSDQTQNNPYHLQTKWLLYTCMHAYIYIYTYYII